MTITIYENCESLARLWGYPDGDALRRSLPLQPDPICGVVCNDPLADPGDEADLEATRPATAELREWIRQNGINKKAMPAGKDRYVWFFEREQRAKEHVFPDLYERRILDNLEWGVHGRKPPCLHKELDNGYDLWLPLARSGAPVKDAALTFDPAMLPLDDWAFWMYAALRDYYPERKIDAATEIPRIRTEARNEASAAVRELLDQITFCERQGYVGDNQAFCLYPLDNAAEVADFLGFESEDELRAAHETSPGKIYGIGSEVSLCLAPGDFVDGLSSEEQDDFGRAAQSLRSRIDFLEDEEVIWGDNGPVYLLSVDGSWLREKRKAEEAARAKQRQKKKRKKRRE